MPSVLRSVRNRKQTKRLGSIEIVDRDKYQGLELDTKVELIRALIPLGLMNIFELFDEEVIALAGPRYARKEPSSVSVRHGSNPGSVRLAIRVPGVRGEIPLRSYAACQGPGEVDETLLKRVLYGISCRRYEAAAEAIPEALGLSRSSAPPVASGDQRVLILFDQCVVFGGIGGNLPIESIEI